nr:RNA-directed DNA polymerase, eukaryota, reverse transcriptase zinc-binding domain protein [Tanacetum cinerariifolium]
KIKWAVEGDENVKFFHGMLNKKRSQSNISGVMVNGTWVDDPIKVKLEFFDHFRGRFDKPSENRACIDISFLNSLSNDQKEDLERKITKEEVKRAVWDCGVDKSPGLDGFSFSFYRHFWTTIEQDVFEAVDYFFMHGDMLNGCNSNFIALIPKIHDANMPYGGVSIFRGLKQGDPLSPFLFILIMESLHISFQRVVDAGLFTGIKINSMVNLSHLFNADDANFLGQWSELVQVLECFFRASGLRINMCKSEIMGVNVVDGKVKNAVVKLGCLVLKTPFTYLCTKVGDIMSRKHAWKEVVDKPVFNGQDPKSKKASWVKWNNVLTPKDKGGLGVSSLYALNIGLMLKWVWRFYSQKCSLWTKVIKAIHEEDGSLDKDDYIRLKLGNGNNTRFWDEKWYEGGVIKELFSRVYNLELDKNYSYEDRYVWTLESDGVFSVASIRKGIDGKRSQDVGYVNSLAFAKSGKFLVAGVGKEPRLGRWGSLPTARHGVALHPLHLS